MMRIAINEAYTILRKRKSTVDIPELAVWPHERDEQLYSAIEQMPELLRMPFLLKYMENMTEKEVAAVLKITQSSVKNRLLRARQYMQNVLREEEEV